MQFLCQSIFAGIIIFIIFISLFKMTSGETKKEKEIRKKATYFGLSEYQIKNILIQLK